MQKALFDSEAQAITVTFHMVENLAVFVGWLVFWCLHLALALFGLLVLWRAQVTPVQVAEAGRALLASTSFAVAGAMGLSVAALISGYVATARWIWLKTFVPWQHGYLLRGLRRQ